MEVDVLPQHLSKATTLLARVAPTGSTLPILANLLLKTKQGRLAVTASDLELCATIYVGAQVHKDGAVTLPAKTLAKMLPKLPDDKLSITAKERSAVLQQDGRSLTLEGWTAEDFPPAPKHGDTTGTVDAEEFLSTLAKVSFCADIGGSRDATKAVHMKAEGDQLTLTATDGYRLASFRLPYTGKPFTTLAPINAITKAAKLIAAVIKGRPGEDLTISETEKALHISCRNLDLSISPVAGEFPDYKQLIPDSHEARLTVIREDLMRELAVCRTLVEHASGIVRLIRQGDKLLVSARADEEGTYEALLDVKAEGQTDTKIAFNECYVADALGAMTEDTVTIDLIDHAHPGVLYDSEAGSYVLMPMSVRW